METPAPTDVLAAVLAVGILFLLRFALALRRMRHELGAQRRDPVPAWRDVTRPMSFGAAMEPNRRHAVRQLVTGLFLLALAAVLGAWLGGAALFGWPVPFAPQWAS
ncbi:hypothetical protein [Aureimonas flava]|nr:hypothetical protein [Aureimonas flava]